MIDQFGTMNNKLVELESLTREKVEKLNADLAKRDSIINNLSKNLEDLKTKLKEDPKTEDLIVLIEEYQTEISRKDVEKEVYLKEITQLSSKLLKLKNEIVIKLESERVSLKKNNQKLQSEKDKLKKITSILFKKLKKYEKLESEFNNIIKKNEQLQDGNRELKDKKSNYIKEIEELNEKNSQIDELKAKTEELNRKCGKLDTQRLELEKEKEDLLIQIKALEDQINSFKESKMSESQNIEDLNQKGESLQNQNASLRLELEKIKEELKESLSLNKFQAEKIELITSNSTVSNNVPMFAKTSKIKGKLYFGFIKGKFVRTSKKTEGINLELDSNKREWVIFIEKSVPFMEKNKALRRARSLPVSGIRLPSGILVGNGCNLKIVEE